MDTGVGWGEREGQHETFKHSFTSPPKKEKEKNYTVFTA